MTQTQKQREMTKEKIIELIGYMIEGVEQYRRIWTLDEKAKFIYDNLVAIGAIKEDKLSSPNASHSSAQDVPTEKP